MNFKKEKSRTRLMALLVVALSLAVLFVPAMSGEESEAAGGTYTYTISSAGKISGSYTPIANDSASTGKYTSSNGSNVGSWGFDSEGYGPFNSFYAAFDPEQDNMMVGHLNPNNLTKLIDGTSIYGKGYNIMWCLPTVYWKTDSSGSLILTNDPSAGGTAYAHTIDGNVYRYIAIGVYEASKNYVGGSTILASTSGTDPMNTAMRETYRDYANNQNVDSDGAGINGHAMVWNFYQYELYKYCALAVMGGWDSQSIAGNGALDHASYVDEDVYTTTGLLDKSGPYAGTKGPLSDPSYRRDSVKVFIENSWGSLYEHVDGFISLGGSYYIDQSSVPSDATSGQYISKSPEKLPSDGFGSSPSTNAMVWGMPTASSGSSKSGLFDYVQTNGYKHLEHGLEVGGYAWVENESDVDDLSKAGLNAVRSFDTLEYARYFSGSRLAFVFDSDPIANPIVALKHGSLIDAGGDAAGLPAKIGIVDETTTYPDMNIYTSNPSIKEGYRHVGWYVDNTFFEIGAAVKQTTTHKAYSVWDVPQITMTFIVDGQVDHTEMVSKGSNGIVYTPTIEDGVFEGWYYDTAYTQKYDASKKIDADVTLYAKIIPTLEFTSTPTASATIAPVDQYGLYFFDATESQGKYRIEWDFGDGNTSDEAIAYNTYAEPGHYKVTLKVTNIYGDSSTAEYEVVVGAGEEQVDDSGHDIVSLILVVVALALAVLCVVVFMLYCRAPIVLILASLFAVLSVLTYLY